MPPRTKTTEASKKRRVTRARAAKERKAQPRPAAGHLEAAHAARLHRLSTETNAADTDVGFLAEPHSRDDLTERLGEGAVSAMTSGEDPLPDDWDKAVVEESGGPFVQTGGNEEFADGTDASNIAGATREPFPRTSSGH